MALRCWRSGMVAMKAPHILGAAQESKAPALAMSVLGLYGPLRRGVCVRQHPPRIEQPLRIQRLLDRPHHGHGLRGLAPGQLVAAQLPDAMFGRQCALEAVHQIEHHLVGLLLKSQQGIAGRLRRGWLHVVVQVAFAQVAEADLLTKI